MPTFMDTDTRESFQTPLSPGEKEIPYDEYFDGLCFSFLIISRAFCTAGEYGQENRETITWFRPRSKPSSHRE